MVAAPWTLTWAWPVELRGGVPNRRIFLIFLAAERKTSSFHLTLFFWKMFYFDKWPDSLPITSACPSWHNSQASPKRSRAWRPPEWAGPSATGFVVFICSTFKTVRKENSNKKTVGEAKKVWVPLVSVPVCTVQWKCLSINIFVATMDHNL